MRIGLVSCVKSKQRRAVQARDLYVSPLFRGARGYVERSCDRWFILSAEHGLVAPDQTLEPYEKTLTTARLAERRAWAERVLRALDEVAGDLAGHTIELHAGRAYIAFGLTTGLAARGAILEDPLEGLTLGQRLAFYKERGRRRSRSSS